MTDPTDEELAAVLARTMTAHEADADPDRARELARTARPAPRHRTWVPVAAAAAAVALIAGVAYGVAGRSPGADGRLTADPTSQAPTTTAPDQPRTTQQNYDEADAASQATLDSLPLPDDAVKLDGKPVGWPDGDTFIGPSDASLTRIGWWSTSMTKAQLTDFFTTHSPDGMQHPAGEDATCACTSGGVVDTQWNAAVSPDPAAYTAPILYVQFAGVGDHSVIEAKTFLGARFAVPDELRITGDVTEVDIDRVTSDGPGASQTHRLPPVRLLQPADAGRISQLVDAFDDLDGSVSSQFISSCPMSGPEKDTVTFVTSSSTFVAELDLHCFGQVNVTVDGVANHVTLDPAGWDEQVDRAAGP